MHHLYGMRGSDSWHEFGDTFSVENPQWLEPFGLTPEMTESGGENYEGPLPVIEDLTLEEAIEVSYIHSREYQTAIEQAYLAALNLTFQRFQFDLRYVGFGGKPGADLMAESIPDGDNSLSLDSRFGIRRLLPTGGQWIMELTNNTLWLFSGGNQANSASVLSYSLVQPLLRGAGRKVGLEDLTQSERDVLYATRNLARFRKQFFTDIVGGSAGYLSLVQLRQNVINEQSNVSRIVEQTDIQRALASQRPGQTLVPLPAWPEGVDIPEDLPELGYDADAKMLVWKKEMSEVQEQRLRALSQDAAFQTAINVLIQGLRTETVTLSVAQLESQLASSRNRLRQSEQRFQDDLDRFKVLLGLPPDMPITIDESILRPFQLIDPRLTAVEQGLKDFVSRWAQLDEDDPDPVQLRLVAAELRERLDEVSREGPQLVESDFWRVRELIGDDEIDDSNPGTTEADIRRQRRFATEEQRQRVIKDASNDERLFASVKKDLTDSQNELQTLIESLSKDDLPVDDRKAAALQIGELREKILKASQSLQVIQIGARVELITLEPFRLGMEDVVQIALENRIDLMNERAKVMDARREVEIAANRLEAVLDVVVEGNIRTPSLGNGNHRPLDFRGDRSSFRAGLAFTAPLQQIEERNTYRRALIAYQRARRDYMAFEDSVKSAVRRHWRQLDVLKRNLNTSRQAIRIAALQYDNAVEEAAAPVVQGGGSQSLNLLNALRDVLTAQNSLIGFWIDYEQSRLNIHRDMGIMEIDAQGVWEDELYQSRLRPVPPVDEDVPDVQSSLDETSEQRHGNRPSGESEQRDRHRIISSRPVRHADRQPDGVAFPARPDSPVPVQTVGRDFRGAAGPVGWRPHSSVSVDETLAPKG